MRILLIDDDTIILKIVQRVLKAEGHECIATFDPTTGLRTFKNYDIDLVITDYEMPGVRGLEVVDRIRNIKEDVPVIMICGYTNDYIKNTAVDNGIIAYFEKPVDLKMMVSIIGDLDKPKRGRKPKTRIFPAVSEEENEHIFEKSKSLASITLDADNIILEETEKAFLNSRGALQSHENLLLSLKKAIAQNSYTWEQIKDRVKINKIKAFLLFDGADFYLHINKATPEKIDKYNLILDESNKTFYMPIKKDEDIVVAMEVLKFEKNNGSTTNEG